MSGPGTVRLHATGVPQLDAQPSIEYWIGAPWVSVDAPPTICACTGSSFWHYSGTAWIEHNTPWKSRHGLTIQYNPDTNIVERLTVVGGTVRRDTVMLGGSHSQLHSSTHQPQTSDDSREPSTNLRGDHRLVGRRRARQHHIRFWGRWSASHRSNRRGHHYGGVCR